MAQVCINFFHFPAPSVYVCVCIRSVYICSVCVCMILLKKPPNSYILSGSDESTREFIQLRYKLRHLFNGRKHQCEKAYRWEGGDGTLNDVDWRCGTCGEKEKKCYVFGVLNFTITFKNYYILLCHSVSPFKTRY